MQRIDVTPWLAPGSTDRVANLVIGGYTLKIRTRNITHYRRTAEYYAKPRVYLRDEALVGSPHVVKMCEVEAALGDRRNTTRGVDAEIDKIYDKLNRAIKTESRFVARQIVALLTGVDINCSYSKTAGCACGCSPGVIVGAELSLYGNSFDIWVIDFKPTDDTKLFDRS